MAEEIKGKLTLQALQGGWALSRDGHEGAFFLQPSDIPALLSVLSGLTPDATTFQPQGGFLKGFSGARTADEVVGLRFEKFDGETLDFEMVRTDALALSDHIKEWATRPARRH